MKLPPSSFSRRAATDVAALAVVTTLSTTLLGAPVENLPIEIQTSLSDVSPLVTAYNRPNDSAGYYETSFEYGVQAKLDPSAPTVLRNVILPYYSNYSQDDALTIRIYANDGPTIGFGVYAGPTPGTLLSEVVTDVKGAGATTLSLQYDFNAANVLPPSITVTLTFQGLGGGNTAGWYTSGADNTVGVVADYFWLRSGPPDVYDGWTRKVVVPEPEVTAGLAGLALLGFGAIRLARRRGQ